MVCRNAGALRLPGGFAILIVMVALLLVGAPDVWTVYWKVYSAAPCSAKRPRGLKNKVPLGLRDKSPCARLVVTSLGATW